MSDFFFTDTAESGYQIIIVSLHPLPSTLPPLPHLQTHRPPPPHNMDTLHVPRAKGCYGTSATEEQAQLIQQKIMEVLEPIMEDLSTALLDEIKQKVKNAKKRHNQTKWTDRDIDPYYYIAERLLLQNPSNNGPEKMKVVNERIQEHREKSSVTFEKHSVSDWCIAHTTQIIAKKEARKSRIREKERKREARNARKRRSSGFYQGGLTPRSPRILSPRSTSISTSMKK